MSSCITVNPHFVNLRTCPKKVLEKFRLFVFVEFLFFINLPSQSCALFGTALSHNLLLQYIAHIFSHLMIKKRFIWIIRQFFVIFSFHFGLQYQNSHGITFSELYRTAQSRTLCFTTRTYLIISNNNIYVLLRLGWLVVN